MSVADYQALSVYPRSPSVTGVDFTFTPLGDVDVGQKGDLVTTSGVDLLNNALLRRLSTPLQGYSRWVRGSNGMTLVDADYGNPAYGLLSVSGTQTTPVQLQQAIRTAASADERIEVLNVTAALGTQPNTYNVTLTYRLKTETELRSLAYVLTV